MLYSIGGRYISANSLSDGSERCDYPFFFKNLIHSKFHMHLSDQWAHLFHFSKAPSKQVTRHYINRISNYRCLDTMSQFSHAIWVMLYTSLEISPGKRRCELQRQYIPRWNGIHRRVFFSFCFLYTCVFHTTMYRRDSQHTQAVAWANGATLSAWLSWPSQSP